MFRNISMYSLHKIYGWWQRLYYGNVQVDVNPDSAPDSSEDTDISDVESSTDDGPVVLGNPDPEMQPPGMTNVVQEPEVTDALSRNDVIAADCEKVICSVTGPLDVIQKPEVIVSTDRCREVTDGLSRHDVIAVDCEGDNLSATGALTLLQISTQTHTVYLFDILSNKEMLKTGSGLKELLESEFVTKVFQSSENASLALYHQFGIILNNVFDTQVAHTVLEEKKGILFPKKVPLTFISKTYGSRYQSVDETVTKRWWYVSDYWRQRPLTEEMIKYASDDVIVSIPEVYTEQKRLLSQHHAEEHFAQRVEENIKKGFEPRYEEKAKARLHRVMERWMELVRAVKGRFLSLTTAATFLSDDHIRGFWIYRTDETYPFSIPPWFGQLRNEQMYQQLTQMNDKINNVGLQNIDTEEFLTPPLKYMACRLNIHKVKDLARDILNRIQGEELRRINGRHTSGQPITTFEKIFIIEYYQYRKPPYYWDLVKNVIRDVEQEIRTRIDGIHDTDMKLGMLAEFHKRFLQKAPMLYISSDMVKLKQSLLQ